MFNTKQIIFFYDAIINGFCKEFNWYGYFNSPYSNYKNSKLNLLNLPISNFDDWVKELVKLIFFCTKKNVITDIKYDAQYLVYAIYIRIEDETYEVLVPKISPQPYTFFQIRKMLKKISPNIDYDFYTTAIFFIADAQESRVIIAPKKEVDMILDKKIPLALFPIDSNSIYWSDIIEDDIPYIIKIKPNDNNIILLDSLVSAFSKAVIKINNIADMEVFFYEPLLQLVVDSEYSFEFPLFQIDHLQRIAKRLLEKKETASVYFYKLYINPLDNITFIYYKSETNQNIIIMECFRLHELTLLYGLSLYLEDQIVFKDFLLDEVIIPENYYDTLLKSWKESRKTHLQIDEEVAKTQEYLDSLCLNFE
jgi:hypothetical protein